jgi:HAE1 family hydrophobic/amphiphilic exporter-1
VSPGSGPVATAVARPVTVLVGVVLTVMFGVLAIMRLPIQLTPDIAVPTLTVTTVWPGAAPTEVESEILEEQEEALKSLSGLVRMESEARLEVGTITLELEVGTPIEEALVRVTNLLSQVPQYPQNARQPVISASNTSGPPLAVITITSKAAGDVTQYRTWVEQRLQPLYERIPGVARVLLIGGRDRELEVAFDETALAARGLTIGAVVSKLRSELVDVSGGDVTVGKRRLLVRTPLAPEQPEELADAVLAVVDGAPVRLQDVATVQLGLRKPQAHVFSDDSPSMVFLLFREAGTNVLEVTRQVKDLTAELEATTMAPRGLKLTVVSDQTGYIEAALDLVRQNLFVGGLLAVLVLLIFLRSVRSSAVVAVAIPVCTLGTALGMSLLGRTINVVSLAGMAFAVGMVVDNAIVVLENIDTVQKERGTIRDAAIIATREVWGAIVASTLTTAVVFIPIITWQDEVGEILRDIAVAISTAVIVSLVVSVLVIPSFARVLLEGREGKSFNLGKLEDVGVRFRDATGGVVAKLARSWWRSFAVMGAALVVAGGATVMLLPSMEYLPTGNRAFAFGILVPPPGYSVEEMRVIGERIQTEVAKHIEQEVDGVPAVSRSFYVGRPENGLMGAGVVDENRTQEFVAWYRELLATVPGMFPIATQASLFGRSIGGGRGVEIDIGGQDLGQLVDTGGAILGAVREAIPGAQVRPIPSLDHGAPEYRVRPDRARAAEVGLSGADIGLAVDALIDGAIIGEYGREGEPKIDVVLTAKGSKDQRGLVDVSALSAAPVATPTGGVVPLRAVATVDEALGPTVIRRIERSRSITIAVSPPDDVALEDAMNTIRTQVVQRLRSEGVIPSEIDVSLSGTAGQLELAKVRLFQVLLLAVVISFLLMAALFEDFLAPIAVMVTVPLAAAGGVVALLLVDRFLGAQTFDMLTAIGFVILIGVVVNNAILVVDGAITNLRAGEPLDVALERAVSRRIRPIFMSALTSIAGLSPLVLFPGSGSELYRGVGAIVLGGLALSTVLTLFVVPAAFVVLWRLRGVKA